MKEEIMHEDDADIHKLPVIRKRKSHEEDIHTSHVIKKRSTTVFPAIPEDDSTLYCEECKMNYEGDCPQHGTLTCLDNAETTVGNSRTQDLNTQPLTADRMEKIQHAGLYQEDEELYSCVQSYHPSSQRNIMQMHLKIVPTEKLLEPGKHDELPDMLPENTRNKNSQPINKKRCFSAEETAREDNYLSSVTDSKDLMVSSHHHKQAKDASRATDAHSHKGVSNIEDASSNSDKIVSMSERNSQLCEIDADCKLQNNVQITSCKDKYMGEKPYKCDVCSARFAQNNSLKKHARIHTGERPYKCDICGITFTRNDLLQAHKRTHTGEKPHKCDVCGVGFARSSQLQTHKRIHTGEKPYKCEVCGVGFTQCGGLKSHERVHTGEKPYKCEICGVEFTQCGSLKAHKQLHTGEKPYKCDVCGVGFARVNALNTHIRIHTGEKPYKCDVCSALFTRSDQLQTHKRIHTGEKPYKCDICGVGFSQSSEVNTHKRIHTGEKPYKCDICGAGFTRSDGLKIHTRNHTGERPFRCDVCGIGFAQSSHLTRHKRKHTEQTLCS